MMKPALAVHVAWCFEEICRQYVEDRASEACYIFSGRVYRCTQESGKERGCLVEGLNRTRRIWDLGYGEVEPQRLKDSKLMFCGGVYTTDSKADPRMGEGEGER